jgi:hypothetical protein
MAANGDWVVPAGLDGERRFGVFEVNNSRRGDKAFFTRLNVQMYKGGGLSAMLHELLTRDIENWAPRDTVPATKALMKQKIMSMDDVERWWYGRLVDGMLPGGDEWGVYTESGLTIIKEVLRADYLEFAKEQRAYRPADAIAFGMRLGKLVHLTNTQMKPADDQYGIRVDKGGRASAYKIPPLSECRQSFEKKMGAELEWPAIAEAT